MADHPPTKARALIQDAKAGRRPITELLGEARAITDPSFVAEALAALAEDSRLDAAAGGRALTDAVAVLPQVDRTFRRAEAGAEVARRAARWRPDDAEATLSRSRTFSSLANVAQGLRGKELVALAVPLAKASPEHRAAMLKLVIHHGADPMEDAKAVLATGAGPGIADAIQQAPAEAQARLLAYHRTHGGETPLAAALEAAGRLAALPRREALRAIIAPAGRDDLPTIRNSLPDEPGERARLLCALAAQADRTGDKASAALWFDEAAALGHALPAGKEHDAILRNVETGRARLAAPSGKPAKGIQAPAQEMSQSSLARTPTSSPTHTRHTLALVDAYEGSLGDVQMRAIARAAPLCWAFGLDLALVGFPAKSVQEVVSKAGKSTGIGEGGEYLEKLATAGRVRLLAAEPSAEHGFLVATTPKPDPSKSCDFEDAARKANAAGLRALFVLVGLGPKGLPGAWMKAAPVHLELTGDNVSLETATAMGLIVERLRQLPAPS